MTAIPSKSTEPLPSEAKNSAGTYAVGRPVGKCAACAGTIIAGEKFMTAVRESSAALERLDVHIACWAAFDHDKVLASWHATMPAHAARKRVFVDDAVLCDLFEKLGDVQDAAKLNFRFVLGLILMRKRLLAYESSRMEGDRDIWSMRIRGTQTILDMLNPRLNEEHMADVSAQLGEILNADGI